MPCLFSNSRNLYGPFLLIKTVKSNVLRLTNLVKFRTMQGD